MRTTCDIRDAVMERVQIRALAERKTIKEILNEALAAGLDAPRTKPEGRWICPEHDLGSPRIDYLKAFQAIDEMEAEAVAEKLRLRK